MDVAQAERRASPAVADLLAERAFEFEFFQAVRLLEWIAWEAAREGAEPRAAVGEDSRPGEELARFRVPASLAFPAAAVGKLKPGFKGADGGPVVLPVSFLGLIGPSGVLPDHYTAEAVVRAQDEDHALPAFLDIFQHRAASLFYRAWVKYRLPLVVERRLREQQSPGATPQDDDPFTRVLRSLVGLGTGGLAGRMHAADATIVYYAGHYTHVPRCALSLARLLEDYFGLPAQVEQSSGRWLMLPADQRTALPSRQARRGLNCALNRDALVGARVWDVHTKFRVRLGPMGYRRFEEFLPGGPAFQRLADVVGLYAGPALEFDVQPVLKKEEVPVARLKAPAGPRSMLNRNGWLASRPRAKDAEEAVFRPGAGRGTSGG